MKKAKSKHPDPHVIICCSGGIDSTALIHYYLGKGYRVQAVHFDYGQPALNAEVRSLRKIEKYYGVNVKFLVLRPKPKHSSSGEIYCRNALFILSAISQTRGQRTLVSLGIHSNSIYYDSSEIFVHQLQGILDGYFDGRVRLDAPFLSFTKTDIIKFCVKNEVPLDLTYSCDRSSSKPCGKCLSCKERARVLDEFNK